MARHYPTRDFFRQMPNSLLARYFHAHGVFGDLDFAAMKETQPDELFAAWLGLADTQHHEMDADAKVVDCGTEALGAEVFASDTEERVVYHTCKSRACPSCGYQTTRAWQRDQWRELPDVPYAHVCLTMPDVLWPLFRRNRHPLHDLPVLGAQALQQWARQKYGIRLMIVVIPHTFGRHLNFNCHLHILVSEGGLREDGTQWCARARLDRKALMPMWRYAVITLLREAARAGVLDTDMSRGALLAAPHRPVRTVVEHRCQAVQEQEAVLGVRRPLCQTAAHCAAPVPDDQPSRNPVRDERHAHGAHRRDHLHAGGVPGHARRPRPRPLPAQRSLLRAARATCEVPDARCRVRAAGAGTAREAATTVVGSVPSEKLRGRSTPGPQRPANALDSSGTAGASRWERASRIQSWPSVAHRLTRSQTNGCRSRTDCSVNSLTGERHDVFRW